MTVAWITGGGTGIGRALAERLYREGASVVITGRRKEVLDLAAREITAGPSSGQLLAMAGDAGDARHVDDVVSAVMARWGAISLLINNAGANFHHDVFETPFEEYQESFAINCLSAIRAAQGVLPGMRKADHGSIVNISSIYGKWGSSRSPSYSVGKFAMAGFTDSMRQSLSGTGVHVMGVYPGFIETSMTLPFVEPGSFKSRLGKTPDELAQAILRAWRRRKPELYFPWYVPWVLRMQRWAPVWSDLLANRVKR